MVQKKLEKNSTHNDLDLDGDGVVSDAEIAASEALSQHEKADAQRRMAWVAMGSMIVFTLAVFLPIFPDARIKALSDLFGLFYIGQAGVVGAYMGMTAYMAKGK
jgi:hypothetical protein|tara:strand:+ start:1116 stop:1427 length:312 start_codon:yes stop_codon:yes gene_type:complete